MNKQKILSFSKDTIYYLTLLFPFAFSIAACFGLPEVGGVMFACTALLFMPNIDSKRFIPVYLSLAIIEYTLYSHSLGVAFGACIIGGILLAASSLFYDKLKKLISSPAVSGVMLATALTLTVLYTTHYFGIGASGDTVSEMIQSYISLGFHPNWRGVLYGTIVMVIMITFPKKFKNFSKTVSASFIALAVTLILNLFLNPSDMTIAINEIPDGTTEDILLFISHLKIQSLFSDLNAKNILTVAASGIALFITSFYAISSDKNSDKKDYIGGGIANGIIGGIFNFPLPYGINKDKNSLLPRITATAIVIAMLIFCEDLLLRIPLHSCAVVIIVGVWQSVKWGELKNAFSGIVPFVIFTVSVVSCLAINIVYGVIIAAVASALYSLKKAS